MAEVYLPFDLLGNSKDWEVGQTYRIKCVVKQKTLDEDGAVFEVIDASSLEPTQGDRKRMSSDSGSYMGK